MERGDDAIIISPENNDQISIPALQKDIPELALMKIKRQDFIKAQKDHGDLKTIYEQVLSQTTALNKSYSLVDELLVKNQEDKLVEISQTHDSKQNIVERRKMSYFLLSCLSTCRVSKLKLAYPNVLCYDV
ncbi:hypothetical protein NPIL_155121 [Nephila pilipes]|uniref:Uncharacterized protein n=1 Tax=Nephila pilipes TaxID=299642 RepID=A0A8X6M812_NEPPI|nr:hypothetical protein NPIL_155121 [Nephila pilipes]